MGGGGAGGLPKALLGTGRRVLYVSPLSPLLPPCSAVEAALRLVAGISTLIGNWKVDGASSSQVRRRRRPPPRHCYRVDYCALVHLDLCVCLRHVPRAAHTLKKYPPPMSLSAQMHAELAAALQSTANKLLQAMPGDQGLEGLLQQLEVRQVEEGRQQQQQQASKLCACVATELPELAG